MRIESQEAGLSQPKIIGGGASHLRPADGIENQQVPASSGGP